MGMYTEILVKVEIVDSATDIDKAVLHYLFGDSDEEPSQLPDHEFFTKNRWSCIGRSSSYYHIPESTSVIADDEYIFSRSDFKNYGGEADAFFEWLRGVAIPATGECYGWIWYEEDDAPTLVMREG